MAEPEVLQPAPVPDGSVHPAPASELGTLSTRNGVWEEGEFALWKHAGYQRPIYDTVSESLETYRDRYFVNTDQRLNDEASSTANGKRNTALRAFRHAGFDGPSIYHRRYPSCPGPGCYAYGDLGWANDQLSSHLRAS
jgi:hypothetical protein